MNNLQGYPGTPQHQHLLQAVVNHYVDDPRVLAIIVFGSLGRGNWDPYSDLDLDVIIADDVNINVVHELERLSDSFANIDEHAALIIPDGEDAGDIVLKSLMGLSIGLTLPQFDVPSAKRVLITFIDILEQELSRFTRGQVQLTEAHLHVLNQVRTRQENLKMH